MYSYVSSIIETVNSVLLIATLVIGFKIFIKTQKNEELVASRLFLKKRHLYDIALFSVIGITTLTASSITDIAKTLGLMDSTLLLNEIFKFNSLAFILFSAIMLNRLLKL